MRHFEVAQQTDLFEPITPTRRFEAKPRHMLALVGFIVANGALLLALSGLALLKEDPLFWRNAGGWPVWFRLFVKVTFYPLLALETAGLLWFSACVFWHEYAPPIRRNLGLAAGAFWLWTGIVVAVVASNNIANLLAGRGLHWHP